MKMAMCIQVKDFARDPPAASLNQRFKDVKLDNVLVNYREGDIRFSDVQLGDLGGACPVDSEYAKGGTSIGAPMWTSPEVIMEMPWNTATDIWSFGAVVRSN
jgi:serine/threonine protein kinase